MFSTARISTILIALGVSFPLALNAQFPATPDRIAGAGSMLFQSNISSGAFGNPAIPDSVTGPAFFLYSGQSFMTPELTETGLAFSIRLPGSTQLSLGYAVRGFDLYRKQHAVLCLSRHFGGVTAGIRTTYSDTQFGKEIQGDRLWSVTPGTRIRFGKQVEMLAGMRIPLRKTKDLHEEEARLGCIYHFSSRFAVGVEAVQTDRQLLLSGVLRYRPGERIEFLGGLSGQEPVWGFGCSVEVKGFRIMLAACHRSWLGFSPGLSVESPLVRR